VHEQPLGRPDANVVEALLVGHGQHNRFNKLLNLLVEAADVGVLLGGSLVDLHGFHPRVVLGRQLFVDDEAFFVDCDKVAGLDFLRLDHADDGQVDGVPACSFHNHRLLGLAYVLLLEAGPFSVLVVLVIVQDFSHVCNHVG